MNTQTLTPEQILNKIESLHAWPLKDGVLYCFGIDPIDYDWHQGNADPIRVYNHIRTIFNGGEQSNKVCAPKLFPVTEPNEDLQDFTIKRDLLIPFCGIEWPNFCKNTYNIWQKYRAIKDGMPPSENCLKAQHCMRVEMVRLYKNNPAYRNGKKKNFNHSELCRNVAKSTGFKINTIRSLWTNPKNGFDISANWAMANENNLEYQNILKK